MIFLFVLTSSLLVGEEKGCIPRGDLDTAFSDDLKAHFKTNLNYVVGLQPEYTQNVKRDKMKMSGLLCCLLIKYN